MNKAYNITGYAKISQGGICGTPVDKRLIAKYAIETLSAGVIFVHNHPSGNKNPSNEDIKMTNSLKKYIEIVRYKIIRQYYFN